MKPCPSCGRDVDDKQITCPYCGANLKRRLTITFFGILAILLAVGGLALLWNYATHAEIPTVPIGQIEAAMNFAYVRIAGTITRNPNFNAEFESLSFWVDDDSGRMLVSAFGPDAHALIESDRVPALGDRIAVTGILRIRDESPSLTLNSPDTLELTRATASASRRELAALRIDDAMSAVKVSGQVRAVRVLDSGLRLITLRDLSGESDVVADDDLETLYGPLPAVQIGDSIDVTGIVTVFDGAPQVTVTRSDHFSVLPDPIEVAALTPISDLGDSDIDSWVRVQGTIVRIEPFSAGVKFTLRDTRSRDIIVLLWQDVFDRLIDQSDWQIGAEVIAQGRVSSFRGELELIPELPLDAAILTRVVVEEAPTLERTDIGTITQDDLGKSVFISGTVESLDQFSAGVRLFVEDATGTIQVVLFDDVYTQIDAVDQLDEGSSLLVLGRVEEFNNALEVIPPNGGSVRVATSLAVAERPTFTPTPITETTSTPVTPTPTGNTPTLAATIITTASATPTPTPVAATATLAATNALTSTPAVTTTAQAGIPINTINRSMIGQSISVSGQVISTSSFSAGFRFVINDGSGSITLVLFDGTYRTVPDRAVLNLGAAVRVTAVVAEFNGTLQLQPQTGTDVIVDQPGSTSIITTRVINTLSSNDIGSLVAVVGDVLRVEGFSSGVSVFVNDGSGEVRVVIFSNVLNFVPNATQLQAGARIRVAGRIDEFNGALELLPSLGYDVIVNP